jgi:hypothetical protein
MAKGEKVVARLPHGYGVHIVDGKSVTHFRDRGEVYLLVEGRNDELLRRNKYFLPFNPKEDKEISCDKGCGRFFSNMMYYEGHKRKRECNDDSAIPTKKEVAELIGADPDKFIMENDGPEQRTSDLSGEI